MSDDPSLKISEFVALEKISRGGLYKLWARGEGPPYFYIGKSRRISHAARKRWREQLEAASRREGE
jgi:hypothetical protein